MFLLARGGMRATLRLVKEGESEVRKGSQRSLEAGEFGIELS